MPRDRIKLADAKALIADGHATPESIAANFDVEDDGADTAVPATPPSRLSAARARVATPTLDRLGLSGEDVKAGRGPQPAGIVAKVAGAGVDAVTGVTDALGGLAGLAIDVATVAPRRSLAAAREFVRTRSVAAAYRAEHNEPLLPMTKVAGEASEDFRKTAREALGLDDSSETAVGPLIRLGTNLAIPIPGMKARSGIGRAEEVIAFYEPKIAAAADDATKAALEEEMRRTVGSMAPAAPTAATMVPPGAGEAAHVMATAGDAAGGTSEATGAARSAEVTAPQGVPVDVEEGNGGAGAADFDSAAYVKEQVARREAARRAGSPSGVLGKGRSLLADIKAKLVDSNAPIEDLLASTVKREKIKLQPSRDITNSIDRVYRAPSIAGQFARDNGIEDVIREVPDLDTLDQYLIAKQARRVEELGLLEAGVKEAATRGLEGDAAAAFANRYASELSANMEHGIGTGRDLAVDARFIDSQAAVYEPFAAKVSEYSRKLLDYVTESGLISPELADHLKKTYPDYAPLQRVFSEIENAGAQGVGSGPSSISGQTVVRKLKGSLREIESPIESMMSKTMDAFTQGEKNKAGQLLASYRDLPGNPFQIEEIVGDKIQTGAHTISYLDQGVKRTFTTTKEIAQAAKSLDVQRLGIVGRIFAAPVRVAKVGITGINPAFLVSNIVKDQITGFINSERGIATLGNPMTFSRALFQAVGHGELFDEMIREGALGTSFDMARNQIPATVASIRSTRSLATRAAYMARHPGQFLRAAEDILARGEEFTRIQHYIAGKQGAIADGLTEEEARIAGARAARENTVNFARRGEFGTILNSGFMYLNAQIQGTRTLLRNLSSRPMATGAKIGTAVFLPVAMATAWNMKDPVRRKAYEDVAEFEKENNIILVPPEPTQDEKGRWRVIKIPLSQEINNLAKVPRRSIEQAFGSDPVKAGEIAEALAGTVSPIGTSKNQMLSTVVSNPAVKVPLEIHYNTNLFTGREIVPSSPGSRYRKELQTGGTARAIGRQLGMSPIDIEEAIRESFGGTGTQVLNLTDRTTKVLSGNKDYPVGGESSLEATRRRFALAFGGEVQRRQKQQAADAKEKVMQSMVK